MKKIHAFILILITMTLSGCASSGLAERPDVKAFITHVATKDHFNEDKLRQLFNQVHVHNISISHEAKPKEKVLLWDGYSAIFLKPARINAGAQFINTHQAAFQEAQKRYGVPPAIISAIIGVETDYGKFLGRYRVIDSLSTLAFNYPPRKLFFQKELEQYLLLTRDLNLDPLCLYGSYAGAVGMPQFMPDSYRQLAVSISGNTPDLWHNPDDAIVSVGNFFNVKGWQANQPVAVPAKVTGLQYQQLNVDGLKTKFTVSQLKKYGIRPAKYLAPDTAVNLLILPTSHGQEFWLVCHNFYVITHYNTSAYYAMAVYQLSEAIQENLHDKKSTH